ncbi:MAG: MAPEG family protein [Rhodobacterales bacterium]|nr:MAPEG family protein [Pseudomonadota bacterium]MDA1286600.1 MAPEG family protein [Pseudomonadota bacterium]
MEYYAFDQKLALVAVFLQVALTFYAVIRMAQVRIKSIRQNRIRISDIALDARRYPEDAQKFANNLTNQFEFPMLLYVAVLFAMVYDAFSLAFAWLCIGFVATRYLHRYIHVTSNDVVRRFQVFLVGIVLLSLAWLVLGLNVLGWVSI